LEQHLRILWLNRREDDLEPLSLGACRVLVAASRPSLELRAVAGAVAA
jgi:hypothetical protein